MRAAETRNRRAFGGEGRTIERMRARFCDWRTPIVLALGPVACNLTTASKIGMACRNPPSPPHTRDR